MTRSTSTSTDALSRGLRAGEEGQTMALGAMSMLILALMVMMSFNVSQAVHEKVRLQQHVDTQAYSLAVVGARAYNYSAYANRAIAAAYVSMMSLHGYMAAASVVPEMLDAAGYAFIITGAIELCRAAAIGVG